MTNNFNRPPLSPAAQAVQDAYSKAMVRWYNSAPPLHERPVGAHPHPSSLAASLRAAADQVKHHWDGMECVDLLQAIAAELEGATD